MSIEEVKTNVVNRGFGEARFERSPKWVRVRFGGRFIVDTRRAHVLFEPRRLPLYYFPIEDVAPDVLVPSRRDGSRELFNVGDAVDAAWTRDEWPGFVAFKWAAMDGWFEEDEEVFVHVKDPYHRVDVLHSTRRVRIDVAGTTVAESGRPVLLFETGLPPRYYLPKTDVRLDLFEHSPTRTECPYKGEADHWSIRVDGTLYEDMAWSYKLPTSESAKIQGLMAFYQERVDSFAIDGEVQPPLETPWSKRTTS